MIYLELFYPLNYESIYTTYLHRPAVLRQQSSFNKRLHCSYYSSPIILLNHLYKDNISNSSSEINLQQQNIITATAMRVWKKYPLSQILSTPDTKSIATKVVIHNIIPLIISLNFLIFLLCILFVISIYCIKYDIKKEQAQW